MKKVLLVTTVLIFFIVSSVSVNAGLLDNVIGWPWGGGAEVDGVSPWDGTSTNVGWISANSTNCDIDGDGQMDRVGGDATAPVDCPVDGTTVLNYGLNVPLTGGTVAGYAWSENIGWIDFAPSSHCGVDYSAASCNDPDGGNGGITFDDTDGSLNGWARIVGIAEESVIGNSGGWTGWIHMNGSNYGVSVDSTGQFSGYAWSGGEDAIGPELGWIDFSRVMIRGDLEICGNSCSANTGPNTSMDIGNTQDIVACYGSNPCSEGSDVTNSANWVESGDDAISLSGDDPNVVTAIAEGIENIRATYSEQSDDFDVTVGAGPRCGDENTDPGEGCDDGDANNGPCPASCSNSCTVNDCIGSGGWIEVAP